MPNQFLLFEELQNEVNWAAVRWNVIKSMSAPEERVERFNRRSGFLFYVFQITLIDDLELRISRLLDPAHSGVGKDNVTFALIVETLGNQLGAEKIHRLEKEITSLRSDCEPLLFHRSRRLAHLDFRATQTREMLPPIKWQLFEDAVTQMGALLQDLNACGGLVIDSVNTPDEEGEVQTLLTVLDLGNGALDARPSRVD